MLKVYYNGQFIGMERFSFYEDDLEQVIQIKRKYRLGRIQAYKTQNGCLIIQG